MFIRLALVWAALLAGLYHWKTGYQPGSLAIVLGVASHWVLDFVSHRPRPARVAEPRGRSGYASTRNGLQIVRHPHRGFDPAIVFWQ
jgi:hypothetical protein